MAKRSEEVRRVEAGEVEVVKRYEGTAWVEPHLQSLAVREALARSALASAAALGVTSPGSSRTAASRRLAKSSSAATGLSSPPPPNRALPPDRALRPFFAPSHRGSSSLFAPFMGLSPRLAS